MPRPRPILPSSSHEEVFAQRYHTLMNWALTLTHHDRQQAEDLVHDTFIHFMISRPDLAVVESEGYFYVMLRNMHVSQMRRALRVRETAYPIADILSISETTSVQAELRNAGQRLQLQDELCRICQYASIRKNKSKIGSAVILRFFHGYYPKEIAAVTRSSRAGVDKMLQRARTEARLYLQDPDSLSFLHGEQQPADLQIRFGQGPEDFLSDLRSALYLSRAGSCLATEELTDAYQQKDSERVTPEMLAHIVCCGRCLDEVNRLLGLPLLASREPEQMSGRDKSDHDKSGGGAGSSGATGDFMEKPRRRLKQVLEHRPKELRVSVNGFILASHAINSELNKLSISAKGEEKIGFVEVFSEDEVRLLFCLVDTPPDGPVEQRAKAQLADNRTLELSLDFSDSWPSLNVTYHDPHFLVSESAANASPVDANPILADSVDGHTRELEKTAADHKPLSGGPPRFFGRLASIIRSNLTMRMFARPAGVTATLAILLIAALILVRLNRITTPILSATDLLQRSTTAEEAIANRTDQVLHRTMSLEIRSLSGLAEQSMMGPQASSPASSDSGPVSARKARTPAVPAPAGSVLIAQQRIEIWHSTDRGITARRLYDDNGSLIAGDWRRSDGVQTIYHHGKRPEMQLAPEKRGIERIGIDNIWQLDASAKDFISLIRDGNLTPSVEDRGSVYVISAASAKSADVVRAALTLNKSDLHATELVLVVANPQLASGNQQLIEYRFTESSFERRSPGSVAPAVFEPEPQLTGDAGTRRRGDAGNVAASSSLPVPPSLVIATPELELQVLKELNQADAFYGEQISLSRTPEGRLQVQGIVETDKRKNEILQALSSGRQSPAVKVQIETVAEAAARQARQRSGSGGAVESAQVEVETKTQVPAEPELRTYLSRQKSLSGEALDQEVRRYQDRVMDHSRQARRHALALKQIAERFSADDLQTLDESSRNQWHVMMGQHARIIEQELEALRRELQPVFPTVVSDAGPTNFSLSNDVDFAPAGKQLFELATALDEAVGKSFSIYASGNDSVQVRTGEFARSLGRCVFMAQRLQKSR